MAQGTVKWFNGSLGFGFITQDDDGTDMFVHRTEIDRSEPGLLTEGQRVDFQIGQGRQGPQAQHVRFI